jgi:sugar O-acyltransferase (sialic acid O-acetyltransferase NeuD family)
MPMAREEFGTGAQLVFIDDGLAGRQINGDAVWAFERFLAEPGEGKSACLAVANSRTREQLYDRCVKHDIKIAGVRAANAIEMDDVAIGEGAIISPFVTFTSNIRVGRCFHANLYSYVEHDCRIGDFVTFAPGVHCNGNVHIGNHAYIGTGALLRQGNADKPLVIGENAIVGMGAVVTRDVAAGSVVVGNPARPMSQD